ncbi:hypothetical protein [Pontibacter brevis]
MRRTYLLLICLFMLSFLSMDILAQAQRQEEKRIDFGASVNSGVSYTGLGITAGVSFRLKQLELIAGPRLSVTDTYRLASGPWGVSSALYYYTTASANKRLQSFINIDYQNLIQKPYCPTGDCGSKRSITHEISLGYGLSYSLNSHISLFNAINIGAYRESLYNGALDARYKVDGLNMLVKLGLTYRFQHEE